MIEEQSIPIVIPTVTSEGKCTPKYILDIPTNIANTMAIENILGKIKPVDIAREKAAAVCPEGKEYLSMPFFFIYKSCTISKGLILEKTFFRDITIIVDKIDEKKQ